MHENVLFLINHFQAAAKWSLNLTQLTTSDMKTSFFSTKRRRLRLSERIFSKLTYLS